MGLLKQYRIDLKRKIITRPHDVVAEIGVFEGDLTWYLLERLDIGTYYCVDPWERYEGYEDKTSGLLEGAYAKFTENTERFGAQIIEKRMTSVEAAKIIPDNSIDVVFIDANHSYRHVKEDIKAWLPKVKPGGLLSGHDYGIKRFYVTPAVRELLPGYTTNKTLWFYNK